MMRSMLATLAMLLFVFDASAQDLKLPPLSPTQTIVQDFSTSKIEIVYSRPSKRNRVIFGDLVPYNEIWRTGANSATKVTFGEDVMVGGKEVKAGSYSLYTKPGANEWEVILNKNTGNWGTNGYATSDDVARFTVKPNFSQNTVETFTISVGAITFSSCTIDISWERTSISIPVVSNNQKRLAESIEKAITKPNIPYQQAANYYYETDQNLDKALEYADKAIEGNPKAFWLYTLKARIAAKLGKNAVAKEAAAKSTEIAKGTPSEGEYARANQKIIDSLK